MVNKTLEKTNELDNLVRDFYKTFGIELSTDKPCFTGEYYGSVGLTEFSVWFGNNGKERTIVFADNLQDAKYNLTDYQRATLALIIKTDVSKIYQENIAGNDYTI